MGVFRPRLIGNAINAPRMSFLCEAPVSPTVSFYSGTVNGLRGGGDQTSFDTRFTRSTS